MCFDKKEICNGLNLEYLFLKLLRMKIVIC